MKYGDIILFKPTSFTGKLIAWIDGSPYSHAAIYISKQNGHDLFIESHERKNGVVITRLEEWKNYTVVRPDMKARPKRDMLEKLGKTYDVSMIGWILWAKVFKRDLDNNDDNLLICSELVDYCYRYKIGKGRICTPKTIYQSNFQQII